MLIVLAILAVVLVLVGVVILWRSSPDGASPDQSDQDSGADRLIDVVPPGPSGGS